MTSTSVVSQAYVAASVTSRAPASRRSHCRHNCATDRKSGWQILHLALTTHYIFSHCTDKHWFTHVTVCLRSNTRRAFRAIACGDVYCPPTNRVSVSNFFTIAIVEEQYFDVTALQFSSLMTELTYISCLYSELISTSTSVTCFILTCLGVDRGRVHLVYVHPQLGR